MDNQNNSNSSTQPAPPSSIPSWTPPQPTPIQSEPASSPFSALPNTTSTWPPPITPQPTPIQPGPTPAQSEPAFPNPSWPASPSSQSSFDAWTPPVQSPPIPASAPLNPSSIPSWTPPVPQPEPTPIQLEPASSPSLSPLDNPWGAPIQPPTIDGSQNQIQSDQAPIQPSWMNTPSPAPNPMSNENTNASAPIPSESVPTDLSHLISNNIPIPAQPTPETLVAPTASNPEIPTLPTQNHKGMPYWLIGTGIGLLLLVAGASAYFILGIGQPAKTTTSLPATIATPTPTPVTQPTSQPVATGSANFGELQGSSNQTATSAADLLRQRQQTPIESGQTGN